MAERPNTARRLAAAGAVLGSVGIASLVGMANTGETPPTYTAPTQTELDDMNGQIAAQLTPSERLQIIQDDISKKIPVNTASSGLHEAIAIDRPSGIGDGIELDPATGLPINPADQEAVITRADGTTEKVPASEAMQDDVVVAVAGGVSVTTTPENTPNMGS